MVVHFFFFRLISSFLCRFARPSGGRPAAGARGAHGCRGYGGGPADGGGRGTPRRPGDCEQGVPGVAWVSVVVVVVVAVVVIVVDAITFDSVRLSLVIRTGGSPSLSPPPFSPSFRYIPSPT